LNRDEPHHIVYEWINLKGHGAMHSSTGLAISAEEMLRMAPPEVIRWLIMQPQPNRHIDFDPGLGLLNSVDKYDRLENDYYKQEAEENSARAFELSQVENKVREKTQILPYRHLVTLVQSKTEYDEIIDTLKRTGEIQDLNDYENKRLKSRIECIRGWLKTQAPDNVKFRIQEIPPDLDLDDSTAKKLNDIKNKMHSIDWNPDAIHNSFYELQDNNNTPAKEYFKIMYLIILGKERGPRLGFFLATMEKDFIIERLGHYLNP
jgi:lysyl-tRNA synthetase class 1